MEALILALGTLLLGLCIYFGLSAFAAKDRVVSVRGLAEREVKAAQAIAARLCRAAFRWAFLWAC